MKNCFNLKCTGVIVFFLLNISYTFSQNKTFYDLFSIEDNNSVLNNIELKKYVSNAVTLKANNSVLKEISENKYPEISISIPFQKENSVLLKLKRFDILSPDAKLISRTLSGNEEISWSDVAVSYTGNLEGPENQIVIINFIRESVTGLMCTDSENYILGPFEEDGTKVNNRHILYKESDLKKENSFQCSTSDIISKEAAEKMKQDIHEQMNDQSATDLLTAKIAIDVDNITYNNFGGSIQNTTNYVISLMSAVSAIFMKENNVKLAIPYLRIWTVPDPYAGSNISLVFDQFVNEWNANQSGVQRTVAHLISTRSNNFGGIAYYNVLCNTNSGYAFTNAQNNIQPLPSYSWDVFATAHEIGHNFGPVHTHNCSWVGGPIDSCWAVEGGCYTGPRIIKVGTIMSYCHRNGGSISFIQGYGPQPRALIRSRSEAASCISISVRPIEVGYPNGLETFKKGRSIQIYWGTSMTSGNVNIELSTSNGSSWQTIRNNVPAAQKALDWVIPDVDLTTQARLRILSSADPGIGDTSNAAFTIQTYLNPYNITLGIEGFWNGAFQVPDTVRFYFRGNTPPYPVVDSSKVLLDSTGNVIAGISNTAGGNYAISLKHRNSIETWASVTVNFIPGITANYNFTTLQSKALGSNQVFKSGRWCIYSGDADQQGTVDLADVVSVSNDADNFTSGYVSSDMNGDRLTDLADIVITHNNSTKFISVIKP